MCSVSSRTITKSRSSRRLRAPLYALTGRTSAYRSSSWRRATLTLLNPEPTGVVTGPFSATLCLRIEASKGSGRGVPNSLMAASPACCTSQSNWTPVASSTRTAAAQTAGPTPSPERSETSPNLRELVAPGAGQGWTATHKNAKAVVIHEIPAPAAEAAAAVPRIQRLAEHPHPALAPVLAWGTDPHGVWVAAEPNEGVPLGTILSRGPLTPPAAAALGPAGLAGPAALPEPGIAMGGFR